VTDLRKTTATGLACVSFVGVVYHREHSHSDEAPAPRVVKLQPSTNPAGTATIDSQAEWTLRSTDNRRWPVGLSGFKEITAPASEPVKVERYTGTDRDDASSEARRACHGGAGQAGSRAGRAPVEVAARRRSAGGASFEDGEAADEPSSTE
jgi:hypothetical protein